jgi:hypothetical protein
MDYQPIANVANMFISIETCDKWFYTTFGENATQETKDYWGANTGHWDNGDFRGLISNKNMLT